MKEKTNENHKVVQGPNGNKQSGQKTNNSKDGTHPSKINIPKPKTRYQSPHAY